MAMLRTLAAGPDPHGWLVLFLPAPLRAGECSTLRPFSCSQACEDGPSRARAPGPGVRTRVTDEGNYYSVDQTAKILKRTPGCIRQMLRAGELEGVPPEETEGRGWKIPAYTVHDRDRPARVERPERPSESPERVEELESE